MKTILMSLFVLSSFIAQSQDDDWTKIPDYIPKSPEAASFLRYGDYPVNLSTGTVGISIPLFDFMAGDFSIPITLNYDSSGIRVAQEATWVGLGWNLNAGATITLDMRDTPDEQVDELMPDASFVENVMDDYSGAPGTFFNPDLQLLLSKSWAKDVFVFSSPTVSGKFIIGDEVDKHKAIVYPPDAFKVEMNQNAEDRQFTITDKFGNKYLFTTTREKSNNVGVSGSDDWTSAWYVDQIVTANNLTVNFTYVNDGYHAARNINDTSEATIVDHDCPQPEGGAVDPYTHSNFTSSQSNNSISITKTYKLNTIEYKNYRVSFAGQTGRLDLAAPSQFAQGPYAMLNSPPSYLRFIRLEQKATSTTYSLIRGFEFLYSYFDAGGTEPDYIKKRLKLTGVVDIIDGSGHTFSYSTLSLPAKNSRSMDAWGYYNGATNSTLIPLQYKTFVSASNGSDVIQVVGGANRTVNASTLQAGTLTQITYPTNGSTKFLYEPNQYYGIDEISRFDQIEVAMPNSIQGVGYPSQSPQPLITPGDELYCDPLDSSICVQEMTLPYTFTGSTVNGKLTLSIDSNNTYNQHEFARISVYKNNVSAPLFATGNKNSDYQLTDHTVSLSGSGYIKIEVYGQTMKVLGCSLKYLQDNDTPKNCNGPGIRLSEIQNFSDNTTMASRRAFRYGDMDHAGRSSGKLIFDATKKFDEERNTQHSVYACLGTSEGTPVNYWKHTTKVTLGGQSHYFMSNRISYTHVQEESISVADDQNNGVTYNTFSFNAQSGSQDGAILLENDWKRGELLEKEVRNRANKIVLKETHTYYDDSTKTSRIASVKFTTRDHFSGMPADGTINPGPLAALIEDTSQHEYIQWHYLKSTTTLENYYNASNILTSSVSNTVTYNYDNPNHLQLTSTVTTSSTGDAIEKKIFYAQDTEMATEPYRADLIARYMVGIPLVSALYRNSDKISETKRVYGQFTSSNPVIANLLPETVKVSKGDGDLEEMVNFYYDTEGNLVEYQRVGGPATSLLWAYNKTQVVAKIENMEYETLLANFASEVGDVRDKSEYANNESSVSEELDDLHSVLPSGTLCSTYVYKPLIGVSTVTDQRGLKTKYSYDALGRMTKVNDEEKHLLKEVEYYYGMPNQVKSKTYKIATIVSIADPLPGEAKIDVMYADGLGRPIENIAGRMSATGTDLVTPIEYDGFGRQTKEWLPYPENQDDQQFVAISQATYNDEHFYFDAYGQDNAYSEKLFEASPLSRVLKQAAPGNDWAMSGGHEIKFDYQANASDEVKWYQGNADWSATKQYYEPNFSYKGYYAAGELYKTITYDENTAASPSEANGSTVEFKDKEGHVILKRTYGKSGSDTTNTPHDTYYVYDQFGNLAYVFPPSASTGTTISSGKLDGLCYQYAYDHRNRIAAKKLPGKQWEYLVYDALDRVVATGPAYDPFGTQDEGWLVTKYDVFGRVAYTGWLEENSTDWAAARTDYITALENEPLFEARTNPGDVAGYSSLGYPATGLEVLTVQHYDDYSYPDAPTVPSEVEGQEVATNVKGLATHQWTRVPESATSNDGNSVATLYDKKGRVIQTLGVNYRGGENSVKTKLDFTGKTLYTVTAHQPASGEPTVTVTDSLVYTPQDRVYKHLHSINGSTSEILAENGYDPLGRLKTKEVGNGMQAVDYGYNIRGWLTDINDTADLDGDLFAFHINYNQESPEVDDYEQEKLYNGNISETFWRTSADNVLRQYGYFYDGLNRLTHATYIKPDAETATHSYDEALSYDRNGNIQVLKRNGYLDNDSGTTLEIDDLAYTYPADSNQLQQVSDGTNCFDGFKDGNTSGADFIYDAKGNLTHDGNKGIEEIKYNHLNLPTTIIFDYDDRIDYLYDATGIKTKKTVTTSAGMVTTHYVDGFQYTGNVLDFFPTAEGYVRSNKGVYNYVYNYTDHLGNVRLSYTWDTDHVAMMEENNYYPFGLKHENYNAERADYKILDERLGTFIVELGEVEEMGYKYKYNGKELQDELGLNLYDYGARNYDAALGRWMNIDPLSEVSRRWSPYSYCYDNPVRFVDPDGMMATDPTELFNTDGKKIGEDEKGNDGTVSIVADKDKAKQIEKNYKNGGVASAEDVQSGLQTTKVVLKQSLDNLQRTVDNGGNKEEQTVVEPNGNVTIGKSETVKTDNISRSTMPVVEGENNTGIHSHVPLNPSITEKGTIAFSSALRPGPDDPGVFPKYGLNVITGRLGDQSGKIDATGKITLDSKPSMGAAFYSRTGAFLLSLTKNAMEKIIK